MSIVRYALNRPYTFGVLALLILIFGGLSAQRMSTDIFPKIDIPTVNVVWIYGGLNAPEMAQKITTFGEIAILNNVDDIRLIESQTVNGIGVIRVSFQPEVDIEMAMAQVTAISQTIIRRMPQGTQPPIIVRYSASSVPILQLALASDTMSEGQLYDYGRLVVRSQIQDIPGMRLPLPYGGAPRQVMVDIDPERLQVFGLSPADVSRAVNAQNLTLPSGSIRTGTDEVQVSLNSSPETVAAFNDLPIREVDGRMIFLRDVAFVRDGAAVQTNIVRANGQSGVLMTIMKLGNASTVDIVDAVLERLPAIRAAAPPGMTIEPLFDQSLFVKAAIDTVIKEAILVACLVSFLVLVFLGSWRSTLIVCTSIPLSILASVVALNALGQTLNVMTLGGLALAIGILVDNATVAIENVHRHVAMGKPLDRAVLEGSEQVAFPELISTLCICIVFVPVFFLSGTAKFLFAPLAMAVVFAMLASYVLARTLVPAMAALLLKGEHHSGAAPTGIGAGAPRAFGARLHGRFESGFERFRTGYAGLLDRALRARVGILCATAALLAATVLAVPGVGRNFFPYVDAGQIRLHVKAPAGTRLEQTAALFADIQREVRAIIPAAELSLVIDNIGLPEPVNFAFSDSVTVSAADGEMLISLEGQSHAPTPEYVAQIRRMLAEKFPQVDAFFKPADITSQILNAGLPAPIDVRFIGRDIAGNLTLARELQSMLRTAPGFVDVTLRQVLDQPEYLVAVDRVRAAQLGLSQQDAANAVLVSLSSTATVSPSYWVDPRLGVSYAVVVQTPPGRITALEDVLNTPIRSPRLEQPVLLRTIATVERREVAANVSRAAFSPMFNVFAGVDGQDLGSAYATVEAAVAGLQGRLKPGNRIEIGGQVASMNAAYRDLARGMLLALVLVYLVMVVNFQSWRDPLIVMAALPMAVAGAVWMLLATATTFSVPALMGIIMVLGVATANSILIVTFANERLRDGLEALAAMREAASTRLRPVIMTALAMIIGMIPMALGWGEGGEQNAPLGRAVIGGLLLATATTLIVVPIVYVLAKARRPAAAASPQPITAGGAAPAPAAQPAAE